MEQIGAFEVCTVHEPFRDDDENRVTHCFFFFLFCFSPPRTPVKVVPQIRLELEPEDNDDPGRNKGTETTL